MGNVVYVNIDTRSDFSILDPSLRVMRFTRM